MTMDEEQARQFASDMMTGMINSDGSIAQNPWSSDQIDKHMLFHDISEE